MSDELNETSPVTTAPPAPALVEAPPPEPTAPVVTAAEQLPNAGEVSDGYHTFNELYEHRCMLFLALMMLHPDGSWISLKHADGSVIDGWFVAGMTLPTGAITYHLPLGLYAQATQNGATELDLAPEWDGHTSADVVLRLSGWVSSHETAAIPSTLPADGLTFGQALVALDHGDKLARKGWEADKHVRMETINTQGSGSTPHVFIASPDGLLISWEPSQADLLAKDWCIIEQ